MTQKKGVFITFEGCEGCGKSTQSRLLHKHLIDLKVPSLLTQEPGGTPLGERVRDLLKTTRDFSISPEAELLLFNACRAQLVRDVILPGLESGKAVICDRFDDSTTIYQGYGRGLDLSMIEGINRLATGGLRPDLTILLDMPPQASLQRKSGRHTDRFEAEEISFHQKIREGYLELAGAEPGRWLVIEGSSDIQGIFQQIRPVVEKLLRETIEKAS
jgi:dTMP kinase